MANVSVPTVIEAISPVSRLLATRLSPDFDRNVVGSDGLGTTGRSVPVGLAIAGFGEAWLAELGTAGAGGDQPQGGPQFLEHEVGVMAYLVHQAGLFMNQKLLE